ncbi:hypothetical protein V6Z12_D04G100400 [Gossypium hirsutum]
MAENLMPALQYNNYGGGAASLKGLFYNAVNFCAFYCMLKFRSHLQIKVVENYKDFAFLCKCMTKLY